MRKFIKLILVILWMMVIFMFSSDNSSESANKSNTVIDKVTSVIIKDDTIKDNIDNNKIVYGIVRKCAHFTEYLILGLLVYSFIKEYKFSFNKCIIITLVVCLSY